jgi:hypothetical protein
MVCPASFLFPCITCAQDVTRLHWSGSQNHKRHKHPTLQSQCTPPHSAATTMLSCQSEARRNGPAACAELLCDCAQKNSCCTAAGCTQPTVSQQDNVATVLAAAAAAVGCPKQQTRYAAAVFGPAAGLAATLSSNQAVKAMSFLYMSAQVVPCARNAPQSRPQ